MNTLSPTGTGVMATITSLGSPLLETLGHNKIVDNLNYLGENLREEITVVDTDTEGGRRGSRKSRRSSFFKHLEPYQEPKLLAKLTLAEKAEIFRRKNPEKWQKRLKQTEEERKLSLGIIDTHPVLQAYTEVQMKRVKEKKLIEARRRLQPRTVTVEMKYSATKQYTPARGIGKSDVGPELSLMVVKGKNLFNHSGETEERSEKCCVKACLFPDMENSKNKSEYRYLTTTGTTRWDHIFSFPNLTKDQMDTKYLIITVTGVTRGGEKKMIGNAALCGEDALIQMEDYQARKPIAEEISVLGKVFKNADETIFAQLQLYPKDWEGMEDITIIQQERPLTTLRRASVFNTLTLDDENNSTSPNKTGNLLSLTGEGGPVPRILQEGEVDPDVEKQSAEGQAVTLEIPIPVVKTTDVEGLEIKAEPSIGNQIKEHVASDQNIQRKVQIQQNTQDGNNAMRANLGGGTKEQTEKITIDSDNPHETSRDSETKSSGAINIMTTKESSKELEGQKVDKKTKSSKKEEKKRKAKEKEAKKKQKSKEKNK